jgi:hypothetical protein
MKKSQVLGIALLALFAFGALTATSAMAVTLLAEWLVTGAAVTTELATTTTGELLLEDTKVPIIGKASVLCSGVFDGWVGPNSLDFISEVLNLTATAITNSPLSAGESLNCVAQSGCETSNTVLVYPIGFPAQTEVELLEQEGKVFFADFITPVTGNKLGYEISECLVLGIAMVDECTAPNGVAELTLIESTTLLGSFSKAFTELAGRELATCTQGGAKSGVVETTEGGVFSLTGGGTLSASSETSEA